MSLKGAHIVFITASLLLSIGFGVWAVADWRETGTTSSLYLGVASFVSSGVMAVYGVWFLKKLRGISFV